MYYYLVPSHTTPGKKSVKIEIQPADNVSEYRLQLEDEQNTTWIAGNCFEITKMETIMSRSKELINKWSSVALRFRF